MPTRRNSFRVRASRRVYENHNKACPVCGEADPLLLTADGRCANCASGHGREDHHILPKAYRTSPEDDKAVIRISPNAHRIVSDRQVDHPEPPKPGSPSYSLDKAMEAIGSLGELALALDYVHEQPDVALSAAKSALVLFAVWVVVNIGRIDLTKVLNHAKQV